MKSRLRSSVDQAVLAFTSPTKSFVTGDPGYEAGERAAKFIGAKVVRVPLTKNYAHDVKAMVAGLRDITRSLAHANPSIKAAAYAELGITVTYHKEGRALLESRPQPSGVADVRVGGGT